jgi:hypothetical protein
MKLSRYMIWVPVLMSAFTLRPATAAPPAATLAAEGRAMMPVVVGAGVTGLVRQAAADLADRLGRIGGTTFAVVEGDGLSGIAVGRAEDFPKLSFDCGFHPELAAGREDYLLRTHAKGVHLLGATELAAQHAVWDFLYRLGYRQYFPGPVWEVIPRRPDLRIALDTRERPAYILRRLHYGYGTWGQEEYRHYMDWEARNRMGGAFSLNTGHTYGAILKAKKTAFEAHPEYLAEVDGKRQGQKFCIANPGLRALVVEYAAEHLRANPLADSISMDPSDGGGWCTCAGCAAMGSVSDRVLTLANAVAEAINTLGLGEKYVGIYAYNQHSPPPAAVRAHPRVIVSAATAFTQGGFNVQQVLEGWQRQGAVMGIREYFSVHTWDKNRPGAARAANTDYLRRTIPEFHRLGARYMITSGGNDWGCSGLGYWLAARMLWDVDEAGSLEALRQDFLERAFGPAQKPLDAFYTRIDGANKPLLSEDLIGRMYRSLQEGMQAAAGDPAITARIADLVRYTRYVELYFAYANAAGAQRQSAFEAMLRYGYRIRKSLMIASKALHRDLPSRDRSVKLPPDADWSVPEGKNPWKETRPVGQDEIAVLLSQGIASNALFTFAPIEFGEDLVPATPLNLPPVPLGYPGYSSRGQQEYFTWVDSAPARIELKATGGMLGKYRNRGNVCFSLFSPQHATLDAVATDTNTPPDGTEHAVALTTPYPGLHRLQWNDGGDMSNIVWPEGMPMTLRSSMDQVPPLQGRWDLYFYVPRGTRTVAGFTSSNVGLMLDADGRKVFDFATMKGPGYFDVPVEAGQGGRLWKFHQCHSSRRLLTVPPYLARNAAELLLPREVVAADAAPPQARRDEAR